LNGIQEVASSILVSSTTPSRLIATSNIEKRIPGEREFSRGRGVGTAQVDFSARAALYISANEEGIVVQKAEKAARKRNSLPRKDDEIN
jgi:hypothetical protein